MAETIWKYELEVTDDQVIKVPKDAKFLMTAQAQPNRHLRLKAALCVWAIVDPDKPRVDVKFKVLGTGNPCDIGPNFGYLGTAQFFEGSLVFHVFMETK